MALATPAAVLSAPTSSLWERGNDASGGEQRREGSSVLHVGVDRSEQRATTGFSECIEGMANEGPSKICLRLEMWMLLTEVGEEGKGGLCSLQTYLDLQSYFHPPPSARWRSITSRRQSRESLGFRGSIVASRHTLVDRVGQYLWVLACQGRTQSYLALPCLG